MALTLISGGVAVESAIKPRTCASLRVDLSPSRAFSGLTPLVSVLLNPSLLGPSSSLTCELSASCWNRSCNCDCRMPVGYRVNYLNDLRTVMETNLSEVARSSANIVSSALLNGYLLALTLLLVHYCRYATLYSIGDSHALRIVVIAQPCPYARVQLNMVVDFPGTCLASAKRNIVIIIMIIANLTMGRTGLPNIPNNQTWVFNSRLVLQRKRL